jgi:hypothetical protein
LREIFDLRKLWHKPLALLGSLPRYLDSYWSRYHVVGSTGSNNLVGHFSTTALHIAHNSRPRLNSNHAETYSRGILEVARRVLSLTVSFIAARVGAAT